MAHVRESCAEFFDVFTDERIWNEHTNLVSNEHKISGFECRVETAARVCEEKNLCTHHLHKSCRKNYVRNRVTFIVVNSALHTHYRNFTNVTEDELAGMTGNCGNRETFDFFVSYFTYNLNIVCIITEAGTEDNCNFRSELAEIKFFLNIFVAS